MSQAFMNTNGDALYNALPFFSSTLHRPRPLMRTRPREEAEEGDAVVAEVEGEEAGEGGEEGEEGEEGGGVEIELSLVRFHNQDLKGLLICSLKYMDACSILFHMC